MKKREVYESDVPIGVVFNCYVNGLGIIRSLGEKNIPVLALDCTRGVGTFSKYCYAQLCPDPAKDEREFVDFLIETGKALKSKGVLFPTNDVWLIAISKYRQELDKYYLFPMSEWDVIQNCVDKIRMYQIADKASIPIPQTLFCQDVSRFEEVRSAIKYPCVIKARIPPEFDKAFHTRVIRVNHWDDIADWLKRSKEVLHKSNVGFIIQELIPGDASLLYTLSAYSNKQAELVSFSVIRKTIQSPPDFGTIVSGKVERQSQVIELGSRLIKELGFYGLSNTEFKWDSRDGQFKLMEINARSGMSIYYTTKSGVNLPLFAYREAIGNNIVCATPMEGRYGATWVVSLNKLTVRLRELVSRSRTDRDTSRPQMTADTASHNRGKTVYAVLSGKDPLPYFVMLLGTLVVTLKSLLSYLWPLVRK